MGLSLGCGIPYPWGLLLMYSMCDLMSSFIHIRKVCITTFLYSNYATHHLPSIGCNSYLIESMSPSRAHLNSVDTCIVSNINNHIQNFILHIDFSIVVNSPFHFFVYVVWIWNADYIFMILIHLKIQGMTNYKAIYKSLWGY